MRGSPDPARLCRELAAELTDRLRRSEDRAREEALVIADLRAIGHDGGVCLAAGTSAPPDRKPSDAPLCQGTDVCWVPVAPSDVT